MKFVLPQAVYRSLTGNSAEWPRDLEILQRKAGNIHFAMDFLTQQNRRNAGLQIEGEEIREGRECAKAVDSFLAVNI